MFLKNKNIIFKIRRSKVTDYAALRYMKKISSGGLEVSLSIYSYMSDVGPINVQLLVFCKSDYLWVMICFSLSHQNKIFYLIVCL